MNKCQGDLYMMEFHFGQTSFLLVLQACTAVVTGMAGCAGTILQREPTPPKTALIILVTSTPQVSRETEELLLCWYLVTLTWWIHLYPLLSIFEEIRLNLIIVLSREGNTLLWRGWSVVSPSRDQENLDQLYTLCNHPWEKADGNVQYCWCNKLSFVDLLYSFCIQVLGN